MRIAAQIKHLTILRGGPGGQVVGDGRKTFGIAGSKRLVQKNGWPGCAFIDGDERQAHGQQQLSPGAVGEFGKTQILFLFHIESGKAAVLVFTGNHLQLVPALGEILEVVRCLSQNPGARCVVVGLLNIIQQQSAQSALPLLVPGFHQGGAGGFLLRLGFGHLKAAAGQFHLDLDAGDVGDNAITSLGLGVELFKTKVQLVIRQFFCFRGIKQLRLRAELPVQMFHLLFEAGLFGHGLFPQGKVIHQLTHQVVIILGRQAQPLPEGGQGVVNIFQILLQTVQIILVSLLFIQQTAAMAQPQFQFFKVLFSFQDSGRPGKTKLHKRGAAGSEDGVPLLLFF